LSAAESRTDPMPIEDLEKLGVTLKPTAAVVSDATRLAARHNSFSEMESQQKLWRWVLVVMFLLLLIETWLGGWLTRSSPSPEREPI
jgi:heme A synthase